MLTHLLSSYYIFFSWSTLSYLFFFFFFFNDTATTEIYTLSLHDALPIFLTECTGPSLYRARVIGGESAARPFELDRKSTRLNSSHTVISYAVFCLKKKKSKDKKDKDRKRQWREGEKSVLE